MINRFKNNEDIDDEKRIEIEERYINRAFHTT